MVPLNIISLAISFTFVAANPLPDNDKLHSLTSSLSSIPSAPSLPAELPPKPVVPEGLPTVPGELPSVPAELPSGSSSSPSVPAVPTGTSAKNKFIEVAEKVIDTVKEHKEHSIIPKHDKGWPISF